MDLTVVIGTTGTGRKVHMAYRESGQLLCDFGGRSPKLTTEIAELSDEGGQENTLAVLLNSKVAPSRLCAHCFGKRIRSTYVALLRTLTAKEAS